MKLQINDHRKIFAVKEEFNKLFPNFKMEFLAKPSKVGSSPSEKIVKEDSKTLGDCRVLHNKGELTLSPSMLVADLKQALADTYGLSIKIFHKSGNEWTEASGNESLSL